MVDSTDLPGCVPARKAAFVCIACMAFVTDIVLVLSHHAKRDRGQLGEPGRDTLRNGHVPPRLKDLGRGSWGNYEEFLKRSEEWERRANVSHNAQTSSSTGRNRR